jgi:hypothetical protein
MSDLSEIVAALEARGCRPKQTPNGYKALCPICQADGQRHSPALSIALLDRGPALNCHGPGRCAHRELLELLAPNGASVRPSPSADLEPEIAEHHERLMADAEAQRYLLGRGVGLDVILAERLGIDPEGRHVLPVRGQFGAPAWLKRHQPLGEPKYLMPPGARAMLYGAHLLEATAPGSLVLVTEGEYDSLVCRSLGYVAVSTTAGADSWRDEWSLILAGREIVVIGDHDKAGAAYRERVRRSLEAKGIEHHGLVWPEDAPEKEDPSSFVARCGAEAFRALVVAAVEADRLTRLELSTLDAEVEPVPWVLDGWLAERDICVIGGEPGAGKSVLGMSLALALVTGRPWLGPVVPARPQRVVVADEENAPRMARRRLQQLVRGLELTTDELAGADERLIYLVENSLSLDDRKRRDLFRRELERHRPDWVLLDSLIRFHRRDENANTGMSQFFGEVLKPLAVEFGCGIIFHHHLAKPSKERPEIEHRLRGASDIRALVDEFWGLEGDQQADTRTLRHLKCRWSAPQPAFSLQWEESDDGSATLVGEAQAQSAETVIRSALASGGLRRKELLTICRGAGLTERTVRWLLGKLWHSRVLARRREGKETIYWLTEQAPEDADVAIRGQ